MPLAQQVIPGRSYLAYVQDGQVLNAGPIWTFQIDGTNLWTLNAKGLWSLFDYRMVIPLLDDTNLAATVAGKQTALTNLSLNTIAKRLVQQAIANTGGQLPIDFESDIAGTNVRTYLAEALKTTSSALEDLTGVIGGPDVAFDPYLSADGLSVRWRLRTGNTEIRQSGGDWVWDLTGPQPNAANLSMTRDATTLATTAYEVGAGADTASDGTTSTSTTVAAKRHDGTLLAQPFPRLELGESRSDVSVPATLQGYADAAVAAGRFFTDTYTFDARTAAQPPLSQIHVGDYGQVNVAGHPILGSQRIPVRIMSISATYASATASIACAPQRVLA